MFNYSDAADQQANSGDAAEEQHQNVRRLLQGLYGLLLVADSEVVLVGEAVTQPEQGGDLTLGALRAVRVHSLEVYGIDPDLSRCGSIEREPVMNGRYGHQHL